MNRIIVAGSLLMLVWGQAAAAQDSQAGEPMRAVQPALPIWRQCGPEDVARWARQVLD